jgi:organic radical activating enzyme
VEDLKQEGVYSDRVKKSWANFNDDTIDTIPQMPWDTDIAPKYVELDFSAACNFKCIYCSPSYSTTWTKEIKQHGPYKVGTHDFNSLETIKREGRMPLEVAEEDNPYVQAFWKWLPDMINNLRNIRVTGGEPLLSKNTFKLIDYIIEHPQPELQFDINSNLGVADDRIDMLIAGIKKLYAAKAVKNMVIFTSCEAKGPKAEYIRHGLEYDRWLRNVDRILTECPDISISVMSTYNVLSVTSYKDFLADMLVLMKKHITLESRGTYGRGWHPIHLDMPYLRYPDFLAAWIIDEKLLAYVKECVNFVEQNQFKIKMVRRNNARVLTMTEPGFSDFALHDIKRLYGVLENAVINNIGRNNPIEVDRKAFWMYVDEVDRRRGSKFLEVFPEMTEFYNFCKTTYTTENGY